MGLIQTYGARRFLGKVVELIFHDTVRNLTIQESLGLKPLLLQIGRSQFRWSGHLTRISSGQLQIALYLACLGNLKLTGDTGDIILLRWQCCHLAGPLFKV